MTFRNLKMSNSRVFAQPPPLPSLTPVLGQTIERCITLQPQASLTGDMDEHSREVLVQMLLRNIRQMYYSRAYCQPRLQRFMIRAQPPPPPSEEEPALKPPPEETVTTAASKASKVDGVRNFAGVVVFVYQAFIRSKHSQERFTCVCRK